MSGQRLLKQLIPIIGPNVREVVWLIHYIPVDPMQSDFFRFFTDWIEMIDSLSLPVQEQHPAWQHPFEIWQVDFVSMLVREISEEVLKLIETRRTTDGDTRFYQSQ
jgi:hypothetical protein